MERFNVDRIVIYYADAGSDYKFGSPGDAMLGRYSCIKTSMGQIDKIDMWFFMGTDQETLTKARDQFLYFIYHRSLPSVNVIQSE